MTSQTFTQQDEHHTFDPRTARGLSEQEALKKFQAEGANELPASRQRTIFHMAFDIVREPMFLLLIAGGLIYLLLGDIREALVLLGSIFVIIGITFYQEQKTERALEALRDLSSPRALVIRDGEQRRIAGREVVRDDLVVLAEGDRVPADGVVLWSVNLSVDESLLTGESVAVRKLPILTSDPLPSLGEPGGDDLPFVFSGTLIVQGQGIAQIQATGSNTELGKIGKALQKETPEETRLQHETGGMVRLLALEGGILCVLVVLLYGLLHGHWLDGLLAGIALAMSVMPEEFPVVLTIFLALGAWRIARHQVLTRRMPAIETLGSATVLCVDKTGTLTMNRMAVSTLFAANIFYEWTERRVQTLPPVFHDLVKYSILACEQDPFDPMEKAILQLGSDGPVSQENVYHTFTQQREYPLSPDLLAISHVWQAREQPGYSIATKGAPEAIFALCHLDETERLRLVERVSEMAKAGLRVLGVAKGSLPAEAELPDDQHDLSLTFVGLIGLADPVRPQVAAAVRECYTAGIRVAMITGDYPGTAQHIARQIGLRSPEYVLTGPELDLLTDEELQERIKTVNIFARVVPGQKLRLVRALKAGGEIVAMTGDGVNDAPALKAAHIGIAMGGRGTDVAREAAALVLLDDDFSSIVQAARLGRRIYDNIRKAMTYILAIHIPIAGIALLPLLFGWPLVLLPVQIVFLELIIDPASSIVFEAEPENPQIMQRPPRDPQERLFGKRAILLSLLQGTSALLAVLIVYFIALARGQDEASVRVMAFTTLVIANLGLVFINRSQSRLVVSTLRTPNAALWWIVGGVVVALALVLSIPALREIFGFGVLYPLDLLLCLVIGLGCLLWFEVFKIVQRQRATALFHH